MARKGVKWTDEQRNRFRQTVELKRLQRERAKAAADRGEADHEPDETPAPTGGKPAKAARAATAPLQGPSKAPANAGEPRKAATATRVAPDRSKRLRAALTSLEALTVGELSQAAKADERGELAERAATAFQTVLGAFRVSGDPTSDL